MVKGMKLKDLAEATNTSIPFISMIENNKRGLTYEMAVKISKALDTTPDVIFLDHKLTETEKIS